MYDILPNMYGKKKNVKCFSLGPAIRLRVGADHALGSAIFNGWESASLVGSFRWNG
jgi:hypothetical protein